MSRLIPPAFASIVLPEVLQLLSDILQVVSLSKYKRIGNHLTYRIRWWAGGVSLTLTGSVQW